MTQASPLIDRTALARHRVRARLSDLFLHQTAADEAKDRASMVNRSFTDIAIVTPFADVWAESFPQARCIPDHDTLDLAPDSCDLIVHGMALHWANDPVGQLIQCRRALRPDGLFIAVLLGGQTLAELRAVLSQAESTITGGLSPRVAPMGEIRDLGALLQRAGFALPVADNYALNVQYRDMVHLMHDLRTMGETNALSGRIKHPSRRAIFDLAGDLYRDHFPSGSGGITAGFELITLTGWAPSASQPKPLRPGSAQARLSDALKTTETKLPDA